MNHPDYLVYYQHKNSPRFQNILELGYGRAKELLMNSSSNYRAKEDYLDNRIIIENHIKHEFLKKGGMPRRVFPVYMSLGESKYLEKETCFNKIRIPLAIFSGHQISFTYSDSMFKVHDFKPEVFLIKELGEMVRRYGLKSPEAQVWDDFPLQYLK